MLGDSLLVAPIFQSDGVVDYYLPASRWTHFLTGQVIEDGRWMRETHDYFSLPLLVRPNSIIAVGANDQRSDYNFANGIALHVFEIEDGTTLTATDPTLEGQGAG
jgi:alpha-D-xyloside xylohydrolase